MPLTAPGITPQQRRPRVTPQKQIRMKSTPIPPSIYAADFLKLAYLIEQGKQALADILAAAKSGYHDARAAFDRILARLKSLAHLAADIVEWVRFAWAHRELILGGMASLGLAFIN